MGYVVFGEQGFGFGPEMGSLIAYDLGGYTVTANDVFLDKTGY